MAEETMTPISFIASLRRNCSPVAAKWKQVHTGSPPEPNGISTSATARR